MRCALVRVPAVQQNRETLGCKPMDESNENINGWEKARILANVVASVLIPLVIVLGFHHNKLLPLILISYYYIYNYNFQ